MKNKSINILINYAILTDGNRFIAVAPHLNIVGFGKTADVALNDFDLAVKSFIQFHQKNNNLNQKLINLGWKVIDHQNQAPKDFSVPTGMLKNSKIQNTGSMSYATA